MTQKTPVLIAGGGMVGLTAAAFLAQHGVRTVTIERLKASSPLPRAAYFHMRTLEMFRSLGIEDRVREKSAEDFVPEGALVTMDSVSGRKLADIIAVLNEGVDLLSPCRRLFLNQPSLEPILRERAREAGATIMQGTEITQLHQDDDGVHVTVQDVGGGNARELHADYLIAADGGHSFVRQAVGIGFEGRGAFSNSLTIYFTADLSPWLGDKSWSIVYVNNPQVRGFFRMNRSARTGFFAINAVGDPQADPQAAANVAGDVSEARLVELIRAGVGRDDLDVRIDGYTRWRATAVVAERMRAGRVFIAGDAAHLMPPNGGFGGNTGIHDAHNLAWKLALVTQGRANDALLDSYESERRPVARFTVEQAFSRYVHRTAPWIETTQKPEPPVDDLHIELGYLYGSPQGVHADPRTTRAMPGSRAPHVWLTRGGRRVSTLDLVERFTVLAARDGAAWIDAARRVGDVFGITIDSYRIGHDVEDPADEFPGAYGITTTGAVLVRPDGYIAWRREAQPADPAGALTAALRRALDPTAAAA